MSRPFPSRHQAPSSFIRTNGKIRAPEIRVIGPDGGQMGILSLRDALTAARASGMDLVEIAPTAQPPVCRIVDFGKFRYEQAKKEKDSKKHQHVGKVKEVQLSPNIDPHDFGVKRTHAVEFLCEDMKVKVTLKFRGREMAHQEFGFQQIKKFIQEVAPWGHPDFEPKLVGKGIHLMISPLPRNKRAKNPAGDDSGPAKPAPAKSDPERPGVVAVQGQDPAKQAGDFVNNPFAALESKPDQP
jgi:translation initiation factor IF-3